MRPRKLFISLCGASDRLESRPVAEKTRSHQAFVKKERSRTHSRSCPNRSCDNAVRWSSRAPISNSARGQKRAGRLVLARSFVSVKRNVGSRVPNFDCGCPIKGRIEKKSAHLSVPFQPRMSQRVAGATFTDHETHTCSPV